MTHTTLHLQQGRTPPDLASFDVRRRAEPSVRGTATTVAVLGSSHYVGVPAIGYYELCSCRPLEGPSVETIPLERGFERHVAFDHGGLAVETSLDGQPLAAFPGPEDVTVAYRFGPDAYTTVDVNDEAIETYHTYPEFDLALRSQTTFEMVSDRRSRPIPTDD